MITKFKIFEQKESKKGVLEGKEEYPFKEKIDLYELGNSCYDPDEDFPDRNEMEAKLKRKILNQYCRFQEEIIRFTVDGIEDEVEGDYIEGKIVDVEIESFFNIDITIRFTVDNKKYKVNPYTPVEVYLKEERKKPIVDPKVDPYGEEDWEF